MDQITTSSLSLPAFLAYGALLLLYLIILRLMLNLLQRMGDDHVYQRSVTDRDIHRIMTNRVETSMNTFNVYGLAIVIAKGGIIAVGMAAIIVLSVVKMGILATGMLIVIVIAVLYAVNQWLKTHNKLKDSMAEVYRHIQRVGSVGAIITLCAILVVLLFVMTWLH